MLLARSQANTDRGGRGEGLAWRRYPLPTPTTPGGGDGERGQGVDLRRRTLLLLEHARTDSLIRYCGLFRGGHNITESRGNVQTWVF